jgi:hypothetical protein
MKFRRKAANVQVGYGLGPPSLYGNSAQQPVMQVIEENGRAFEVPFEQFLAQYEPAADMAEAFLDGLRERHSQATAPPEPPALLGYQMTEGSGPEARTLRIEPIEVKGSKDKKKRR